MRSLQRDNRHSAREIFLSFHIQKIDVQVPVQRCLMGMGMDLAGCDDYDDALPF